MNQLINAALDSRWNTLQPNTNLATPDSANGARFSIATTSSNEVEIVTSGGTPIKINRQAFEATLEYLVTNQHMRNNPCQVGSNKDINLAGPLCVTSRNANGANVMIINYLLPLLAHMDLVGIDGNRPNTTWLR